MDIKKRQFVNLTVFTGVTEKGKKWLVDNMTDAVVTVSVQSDVAEEFTTDLIKAGLKVDG